jgi:transposase
MSQYNLRNNSLDNKNLNKLEETTSKNSTRRSIPNSLDTLETLLQKNIPSHLRPEHRRRLEIILRANMGQSQSEICAALKCSEDTARYWMAIAETEQVLDRLERPIGRPKTVSDDYLNRLQELVTSNPKDYDYPFQRWTAYWLGKHLSKEFGIEVSDRHINRLLKQMGLSTRQPSKRRSASHKPWHKGITIDDLIPPSSSHFSE